ncbi:MAG: hypothetical protein EOO62_15175, partial [Hymenobacter sp.]
MKKILCLLPSLLIMAALAGCCANNSCNCNDALADALFFKINYTSHRQYNGLTPTSFSARDVDTIRIYRTNRPPTTGNTSGFIQTTDVVTIARQAVPGRISPSDTTIANEVDVATTTGTTRLVNQDLVVINNASPFASTSTTKLSGYDYRIEVVQRGKILATYSLTNVALAGRYDANGCCTCYQNTGKTYTLTPRTLTSTTVNAGETDSTGVRRIVRLPFVP